MTEEASAGASFLIQLLHGTRSCAARCASARHLQTGHCTRCPHKSKGKCTPVDALAFFPPSDAFRMPKGAGRADGNTKKIGGQRNDEGRR